MIAGVTRTAVLFLCLNTGAIYSVLTCFAEISPTHRSSSDAYCDQEHVFRTGVMMFCRADDVSLYLIFHWIWMKSIQSTLKIPQVVKVNPETPTTARLIARACFCVLTLQT